MIKNSTVKKVSAYMLECIANEPHLLKSDVPCVETWNFTYDPKRSASPARPKDPQDPKKLACQNQIPRSSKILISVLLPEMTVPNAGV
ncbi:hypothetical protein TNCV_5138031 [Trichonephila clavipes]|nr:hypothetical protein TNCV_5138031 [Trichonephila clavipes]